MSTEVDLIHGFMHLPEVSPDDLPGARSILDDAIADEAPRAVDAWSPAPARRGHRRSRRVARWAVGVTLAAAATAAVIFQVVPSTRVPTPPAAAAEIARLADAVQPVPPLGPGQWYQYQLQGELSANVSSGSRAATTNAIATIPITIGEWSNSSAAVCTSQQFGTATFASSTDAQAWQTMGLADTPANQPATGCSAGVEASVGGGGTPLGPIDVSTITHDPATLASELQGGSTGIGAIDTYATREPAHVAGFLRLTVLLVGPLKGQWSGFGQEMLNTLALLPGIASLGTMTSHSGAQGLGFSMPTQVTLNADNGAEVSSFTPPTLILDSQSGDLLEVRHLDYPVLQSAAQDFVASPSALVYSQGVSYGVTAQWMDRVAGLQVISQSSVPSWISTYHIIEAVTTTSATASQLSNVVNPFLGHGNSAYSDGNTPAPGETTYDITIMGTAVTVQDVINALTGSGLFTTVSVKL
jgi:hypothetical protein